MSPHFWIIIEAHEKRNAYKLNAGLTSSATWWKGCETSGEGEHHFAHESTRLATPRDRQVELQARPITSSRGDLWGAGGHCSPIPVFFCPSPMLGSTEFLSPNTERRERSTAGSLTVKPAIALSQRLPVRRSTLPYGAWAQRRTRFRTAREPETPGPEGRRVPPPALSRQQPARVTSTRALLLQLLPRWAPAWE